MINHTKRIFSVPAPFLVIDILGITDGIFRYLIIDSVTQIRRGFLQLLLPERNGTDAKRTVSARAHPARINITRIGICITALQCCN